MQFKQNYGFSDLCLIIAELRGENGCPWDKKQTYESLTKYLIEESYEYIDAVNEKDKLKMCDELGDILLQVMLNSEIAKEENAFDINSVIDGISKKMLKRHPHVFGDVSDNSIGGILSRWEEIKKEEKGDEYSLKSVGKHLPSMVRAAIIAEKSKKMCKNQIFLQKNLDKLKKMLDNMDMAVKEVESSSTEEQKPSPEILSEMMMTVIELFVLGGYNLEIELNREIERYISRFENTGI
jgi:tetrapyrrole methylase family protein/MazG family protein